MDQLDLQQLEHAFGIENRLTFKHGPGGITIARIDNTYATAEVALLGGHVLSFQPHGEEPVLWMSRHSNFEIWGMWSSI